MNKLILEVDVKVVTERVQKEIPLPLYLRIDYDEYLHIDEHGMCCYLYIFDDGQQYKPCLEFYQEYYTDLEDCHKKNLDKYLKQYEDYLCSEEEFTTFKKSLVGYL